VSRGDPHIVDYLLGELAPAERDEVERRMREDARFAERVERMRAVVTGLDAMPAEAWDPPAPPPLAPLPAAPPARTTGRARRLSLRPALAAVACVALVAAGIAIGALAFDGGGDDGARGAPIALRALQDAPGASGVARTVAADEGGLRVQVVGLAPSGTGDFYELWLLDDAQRMVALGSFRVPASGHTTITVPLPGELTDYRFIDVSVERDDGDPGHSGRSVLRAPTSA
jgi:anti-sigma-K factor RskA